MRFAQEAANVVVTSRTRHHVERTCELIEQLTERRPLGMTLDVRSSSAVAEVMTQVAERYGRLDVLVCTAGVEPVHAPTVNAIDAHEWNEVLDVNLSGAFRVVKAAWDLLAPRGVILTVGSVNSISPRRGAAAYAASKSGLLQFTRTLAIELAPRGIRANCVCPGNIDTPLTDAFADAAEDSLAQRQSYALEAHLGRLGTPGEVAAAALQTGGVVLIAWEHKRIAHLANALLGDERAAPQSWPDDRFDVVWAFDLDAASGKYRFAQCPQLLLAGDRADPIAP